MTTRDVRENGVDESRGRTTVEDTCPECDGSLVPADGETVCTECGLVVAEDRLDRGPEWRSFETDTRKRTGAPHTVTMHDGGLSTIIGRGGAGSNGNSRRMNRLRRHHDRSVFPSKGDRNLAHALGEIARLTGALDLSQSVRERASAIYRSAHREELIQGRSIEAMAAGSVYAACRCGGATRTLAEVAEAAPCPREKVEMGYSVLNRELGLPTQVTHPAEYIPQMASAVGASDSVRKRAMELTELAAEHGLTSGRHPGGVAAACLYLAGHENGQLYTQQQIADLADVTPFTLRSRFNELRELR